MLWGRPEKVKARDVTPLSRPSEAAIREELERLLASPVFAKSLRHKRFLAYVVDRVLAGSAQQVKEWTLATEVFDRPASYDPKVDTVVRVEARRLRARLQDYYAGPGQSDPVRFVLPKGSYVLEFEWARAPETAVRRPRLARYAAAAAVIGAAILILTLAHIRSIARTSATLANGRRNSERYFYLKKPEYFEVANRLLQQALVESPRSADALSELGLLYGRRYQITGQGEWRDRAQDLFQRAVALDACHPTANAVLSSIAREYGDFDRAVEIGRRAVSCDASSAQAHNALGLTWLYMGFYEAAEAEFRTAAQRDPSFLSAALNLSESLLYQQRLAEARAAAQRALTIEPLSPLALLVAADVDLAREDDRAAEALWTKIAQVAPDQMAPLRALFFGFVNTAHGDTSAALQAVREYRHAAETGGLLWAHEYVRLCIAVEGFGVAQECMKGDPHFQEYRGLLSARELLRFRSEPGFASLLEQKYDRWQRELKKYGRALMPPPPVLPAPHEFLQSGQKLALTRGN